MAQLALPFSQRTPPAGWEASSSAPEWPERRTGPQPGIGQRKGALWVAKHAGGSEAAPGISGLIPVPFGPRHIAGISYFLSPKSNLAARCCFFRAGQQSPGLQGRRALPAGHPSGSPGALRGPRHHALHAAHAAARRLSSTWHLPDGGAAPTQPDLHGVGPFGVCGTPRKRVRRCRLHVNATVLLSVSFLKNCVLYFLCAASTTLFFHHPCVSKKRH